MKKTSFRSFKIKYLPASARIKITDQFNGVSRTFSLSMGAVPSEEAEKVLTERFSIEISGVVPLADNTALLLSTNFTTSIK